jgi:transcriptional regulator with XRE-family HTH domain
MTLGARLREERERLGLSQPAYAAIASTTKQTLFSWETGKTAPDGFQLAALADGGTDVLYVVTGERSQPLPPETALPQDERALLDAYRACPPEARRHLIQSAALLGAGLADTPRPSARGTNQVKVSARGGHAAGRDITIHGSQQKEGKHGDKTDGEKPRRPSRRS